MESKFFKKEFVEEYKRFIKNTLTKNNVNLIMASDLDTILSYKSPAFSLTRKSRTPLTDEFTPFGLSSIESSNVRRESLMEQEQDIQAIAYIQSFINKCPNIDERYVSGSITAALNIVNYKYDIILIMDRGNRVNDIHKKESAKNKSRKPKGDITYEKSFFDYNIKEGNKILGVLISQKGECRDIPNAMSVKMICANRINYPNIRPAQNLGTILLGMFLFALKKNKENGELLDSIAILELLNYYNNMAGFCAYSKFGFQHDPSMKIGICYPDINLLPMSVDTTLLSYTDIIDVVNGVKNIKNPILCDKKIQQMNEDKQTTLAGLYGIIDHLEMINVELNGAIPPPGFPRMHNPRTVLLPVELFQMLTQILTSLIEKNKDNEEFVNLLTPIKQKLNFRHRSNFLSLTKEEVILLISVLQKVFTSNFEKFVEETETFPMEEVQEKKVVEQLSQLSIADEDLK
jgi:hypothetical protein